MSVRNALKNGTDLVDEAGKPSHWNNTFNAFYRKVYYGTTTSISGTTAEVDLTSVTIPSSDWNASATSVVLVINAPVKSRLDAGKGSTIFKLYIDNVQQGDPLVLASNDGIDDRLGGSLAWVSENNDLSGTDVVVKVTGQPSISSASHDAESIAVVVDAIYNNN